jgi:hypothetical protein
MTFNGVKSLNVTDIEFGFALDFGFEMSYNQVTFG